MVIPAEAGIQRISRDSRLRGNDATKAWDYHFRGNDINDDSRFRGNDNAFYNIIMGSVQEVSRFTIVIRAKINTSAPNPIIPISTGVKVLMRSIFASGVG